MVVIKTTIFGPRWQQKAWTCTHRKTDLHDAQGCLSQNYGGAKMVKSTWSEPQSAQKARDSHKDRQAMHERQWGVARPSSKLCTRVCRVAGCVCGVCVLKANELRYVQIHKRYDGIYMARHVAFFVHCDMIECHNDRRIQQYAQCNFILQQCLVAESNLNFQCLTSAIQRWFCLNTPTFRLKIQTPHSFHR